MTSIASDSEVITSALPLGTYVYERLEGAGALSGRVWEWLGAVGGELSDVQFWRSRTGPRRESAFGANRPCAHWTIKD